jgi:hypothetical protein
MLDAQILSRYITVPLSESEVSELEHTCGQSFPPAVREWLKTVGAPQNVCHRLPVDESHFAEMQECLPAGIEGLFAFASDEDLAAVFALDPVGHVIQLDYETRELIQVPGTLTDYVLSNLATPIPLAKAKWHTQLSFTTADEKAIVAELSRSLSLTDLTGWEYEGTSPADVVTHINRCTSPHGPTRISRLEHHGWSTPAYFFNCRIAIDDIRSFKSLFRRFQNLGLGFKLINYGLLDLDDGG